MAKIVERPLKIGKSSPVKDEHTRDADTGKMIIIRTVDANSKTFTSDISHAFRSNVDAALRSKKK